MKEEKRKIKGRMKNEKAKKRKKEGRKTERIEE